MLNQIVGARREASSSWDMTYLQTSTPDTIAVRYTVTTPIPQDLNPAYRWVLFPCFTVLVGTIKPITRKHGLAAVDSYSYVDGVFVNRFFLNSKVGWGAAFPNDPQSDPTPLPTQTDRPVEVYYEPGYLWQYFWAAPVVFRRQEAEVPGTGPAPSTYTVGLADWPFDWFGLLPQKGDQFSTASVYADDYFFMTPGATDFPHQLVMTFEFPVETVGAEWTVVCSELVVVPFGDSSPSTVDLGLGLPGMRRRGLIVGHGADAVAV